MFLMKIETTERIVGGHLYILSYEKEFKLFI